MSIRGSILLHLPSTKALHPSKHTSPPIQSLQTLSSKLRMLPASNSASSAVYRVPGLSASEIHGIADQTFQRYHINSSSTSLKRSSGIGVSIIWFRHDLRVLDNEALFMAWVSSQTVLPVYCVDPRQFGTTYYFGFPKTGAFRAQFLTESLTDLKNNLKKHGLDLLIRHGKPEEILPPLAKAYGAHTVFAQKETCSEELTAERNVSKALKQIVFGSPSTKKSHGSDQSRTCKLELLWGSTLYHVNDLPFDAYGIPNVYTHYRKSIESTCNVRGCINMPLSLGPTPQIEDWGCVPSTQDLVGNHNEKVSIGCLFLGGESASLSRIHEYFWKKDLLKTYKETRNGMLGPDYSTKFSPWLAYGCLSPRLIYEEVKRYEKERISNDSTYWVLFELIWRDYFKFLSVKYGNSIFQVGGPRKLQKSWSQDKTLFEAWREGQTGYPLIDANMKELSTTGFMSNRGRQIVCSFLVRDMGIDWRMGAEWFETCLLDYDPCANYGNWTYGAGVGNDPREDCYFSIPKQAQVYDPDGEYVAFWLPMLRRLPRVMRHSPGNAYVKPVVSLKFGKLGRVASQKSASAMGQSNFRRS